MKILLDIGHPAHIHYFKNVIKSLELEGYEFLVTARDKEVTFDLLKSYGINYISRGKGKNGLLGKLFYTIQADKLVYKVGRKFDPDLFLSFASPYAAHVAKLLGKKHIAFDDTENAKLAHLLYRPFTTRIYSPSSYRGLLHKNQLLFNGFMELSYLHPDYFKPDKSILKTLNIGPDEKFVILRFVSWNANHDIGHKGLSLEHKIKCVKELSAYAKVFITSESDLPEQLEKYRMNIPPNRMHDIMAFATLLYGESATMASECAVLGIPSIYHDDVGRGYTTELEDKYQIVFNFSESEKDQEKGLKKAIEILQENNPDKYLESKTRLIQEKIDVVQYMVEKIKEASKDILKI